MSTQPITAPAADSVGWTVAGRLLEAFSSRDYLAMAACVAPTAHMRGLVPSGSFEITGDDIVARFRSWFGGWSDFDVIDATIGSVGPRAYVRWRVRVIGETGPMVAEQHLFLTGSEDVESLDLMCSGFQREGGA